MDAAEVPGNVLRDDSEHTGSPRTSRPLESYRSLAPKISQTPRSQRAALLVVRVAVGTDDCYLGAEGTAV